MTIPSQSGQTGLPITLPLADYVSDADGDTLTFFLQSGTLPPGIVLDGLTGQIAGTPVEAGEFSAVVRVEDGYGGTAVTNAISWAIDEAAQEIGQPSLLERNVVSGDVAVGSDGFDLIFSGNDLLTESGLRSSVIVSLFTDRRANTDDILPDGSDDLRGCWMDAFESGGESIGSRLWLLSREKETQDVLARAEAYAEESLQWIIDDGHALAVSVSAERVRRGVLGLRVTITLPGESEFSDVFDYNLEAA